MEVELRSEGPLTRTIHTEMDLDTQGDHVWRVWTDLEQFSSWNPVMTRVRGRAELGAEVRVGFRMGVFMEVPCVVDDMEPGRRLSWRGGTRGLLRARHYFECHPLPDGSTHIVHGETFSGLLVPPLWPALAPQLRKNYQRINDALAAQVRKQSQAA